MNTTPKKGPPFKSDAGVTASFRIPPIALADLLARKQASGLSLGAFLVQKLDLKTTNDNK